MKTCRISRLSNSLLILFFNAFLFAGAFNSTVAIDKNFTEALNDPNSEEFQQEAANFCDNVDQAYASANISQEYTGCIVTGFG